MLYVEDNPANLKLMETLIDRMAGITMVSAHTGELGLELAEVHKPDVIILDINLPGLDGLEVLRGLRARGDARPVLLLTANAEIEARVRGLDAGADDYLSKPFDMDELEARIRALLRRPVQSLRTALTLGPLSFDTQARQLSAEGAVLDLPRRELAVIEVLIAAARFIAERDR